MLDDVSNKVKTAAARPTPLPVVPPKKPPTVPSGSTITSGKRFVKVGKGQLKTELI